MAQLGRPEAALLGGQYLAKRPTVSGSSRTRLWAPMRRLGICGHRSHNGSQFGRYGIEIDATTVVSPPGTQVLARVPDLFGPGRSAEMTYYETAAGARVFSAGVLNFGGTLMLWPEVGLLLDNVWRRLTSDLPIEG